MLTALMKLAPAEVGKPVGCTTEVDGSITDEVDGVAEDDGGASLVGVGVTEEEGATVVF